MLFIINHYFIIINFINININYLKEYFNLENFTLFKN